MGQAKRRGSFEERKELAITKKAAEPPKKQVVRPRGKSNAGLLMAAALAATSLK
jgi:hypothetical protein